MSDDFSPIRPRQVPLSHGAPESPAVTGRGAHLITWALGVLLALAVLGAVFFLLPAWLESRPAKNPTVADPAPAPTAAGDRPGGSTPTDAGAEVEDAAPPPFQQLQRQQAREQAQEALSRFVELQIQLEDEMQVGAWGAEAYQGAKDLATAGDEQFVREAYAESLASYEAAADALAALIERGRALLEESIDRGAAALAARDQETAAEAFELAATIAPEDPRVTAGQARLALLPEISELMRRARNQELADNWSEALATYERIEQLDPATTGLDAAMARVAEGQRRARVQGLLSDGFAELDAGRFDAARRAFRQALDLDPGNRVAEGGLEQVTKQADVARINALKSRADAAAAQERWGDAADLYGQVLALDGTIQFAQAGRARAEAQQRTRAALERILASPDKLSSDKLYREAKQILERAESLEPRGEQLASRIADVRQTLETYANPVPVLLRSDNRTEVTLSTVGTLGAFEEKRLELRPGSYTVIGSRDGCRDIREQIVVRPNMNPVDIRCAETL